jgi:hypothetical protein
LSPSTVTSANISFIDNNGIKRDVLLSDFQGFGTPDRTIKELAPTERDRRFLQLHDRIKDMAASAPPTALATVTKAKSEFPPTKGEVAEEDGAAGTLTFCGITEVDETCIDSILGSSHPCKICYHEQIGRTVALLEAYDSDPKPLLNKIPYMRKEQDPRRREEAAADYHSVIDDINIEVRRSIAENQEDLTKFVSRLKSDGVPADLAKRALKSFGAFSALRGHLKKFYDVQDDNPDIFFESYAFNKDPCYCYLDWAPRMSATGRRVFGYDYYVGARVGSSGRHYEYVMLPLKIARRLLADGTRGDPEAFYLWVLPQLYIVGAHEGVDKFPAGDWKIILLQGASSGSLPCRRIPGKGSTAKIGLGCRFQFIRIATL